MTTASEVIVEEIKDEDLRRISKELRAYSVSWSTRIVELMYGVTKKDGELEMIKAKRKMNNIGFGGTKDYQSRLLFMTKANELLKEYREFEATNRAQLAILQAENAAAESEKSNQQ